MTKSERQSIKQDKTSKSCFTILEKKTNPKPNKRTAKIKNSSLMLSGKETPREASYLTFFFCSSPQPSECRLTALTPLTTEYKLLLEWGKKIHIRQVVLRQSQRHLLLSLRTHGKQTSFRWQIQFLSLLKEMMMGDGELWIGQPNLNFHKELTNRSGCKPLAMQQVATNIDLWGNDLNQYDLFFSVTE